MKTTMRACAALLLAFGLGAAATDDHGYPPGGPGGSGTPLPPPPTIPEAEGLTPEARAAVEQDTFLYTQNTVERVLFNMIRRMGRRLMVPRVQRLRLAGPLFHDFEARGDVAYTDMQMTDTDIGGDTWEETLSLSSGIGSRLQTGIGAATSRTCLRGAKGTETETTGLDAFANVEFTKFLSAGAFVTGSQVDVEDVRGDGSVSAGGLTVSGYQKLWKADLTGTLALSRQRQDVLEEDYDTQFTALVDAQYPWSDRVSTSVYGLFSDSLLNDGSGGDRTFGSIGAEVMVNPADWWSITLGCERTVALSNLRDFRLNAGVSFSW